MSKQDDSEAVKVYMDVPPVNTSKSLDSILEDVFMVGVQHESKTVPEIEKLLAKSRAAIVEAVEGLLPPEFEQPKRYLKEHTELQRATTKATVEGHNQCRVWMLQAIKEWQNHGE